MSVTFHAVLPSVEKIATKHNLTIGTAAEVGELVILSGWVDMDLEAAELPVRENFEQAARGAINVIDRVLSDMDLSLHHVVKVNAFITDPAYQPAWGAVFDELFAAPRPLRTTLVAGVLSGPIELDVIAAKSPRTPELIG